MKCDRYWSIMKEAKDRLRLSLSRTPYPRSIWTGEESKLEPMHNCLLRHKTSKDCPFNGPSISEDCPFKKDYLFRFDLARRRTWTWPWTRWPTSWLSPSRRTTHHSTRGLSFFLYIQCSGSVTFWSGSLDLYTGLQICLRLRILLFLAVAFKMPTKNKIFYGQQVGSVQAGALHTTQPEVCLFFIYIQCSISPWHFDTDPDPWICAQDYGSGSLDLYAGLLIRIRILLFFSSGLPMKLGSHKIVGIVFYLDFFDGRLRILQAQKHMYGSSGYHRLYIISGLGFLTKTGYAIIFLTCFCVKALFLNLVFDDLEVMCCLLLHLIFGSFKWGWHSLENILNGYPVPVSFRFLLYFYIWIHLFKLPRILATFLSVFLLFMIFFLNLNLEKLHCCHSGSYICTR